MEASSNLSAFAPNKSRKINFGSGYDKKEGYINVDVDPACKPDLLIVNGDYSALSRNYYEEIFAKDVLEHIPRTQTLSVLLDWSDFLADNGKLFVETSSILGVAHELQKTDKFEQHYGWTLCLFGSQAHPGDFHHTGFTEVTLRVHLLAAAFAIDSFKVVDKWLFSVEAHKTSNWTDVIEQNRQEGDEVFTRNIFLAAFGREPDKMGRRYIMESLGKRTITRHQAAKHLFQSPERLHYIAKQHSL